MIIKNINNSNQLPNKSPNKLINKLTNNNAGSGKKTATKLILAIVSYLSVFTLHAATTTCTISPNNRDEFIQNISLNDSVLSNDITLTTGDVLALTPAYSGYAYKDNWSIWIDLNNDGDFADSNELVFSSSEKSNTTISAALDIPPDISVNNTDMRIVLHDGNISSDSCGFNGYGDSKDFSVNVSNDTNTDNYALNQQPRGGINEHILSVEIDNVKYTTGDNSGYVNLTDEKTFIISDGDLITLTPTSNWQTDWAVWIDDNNNGLFDSNEKVFSDSGQRGYAVEGMLDLSRVSIGNARMRIAMNGDGVADANGFKYGEIEDYTVNVQPAAEKEYGPQVQWQHDSVNVKVFRFDFADVKLNYPTSRIDSEFKEIIDFFDEQSYGRFKVNYDIYDQVIDVKLNKSAFDGGSSWNWVDYYEAKLIELGEDLSNKNDNTIYMILAPQIMGWDEQEQVWFEWGPKGGPDPGAFRIYDGGGERSKAGGIAHEMGHAMGLHHAEAIDGGKNVLGSGDIKQEKIGYGNVFSMMGYNAWGFGGFNLYYKNFFKAWEIDAEVPLVTQSGTYRVYALDQGVISGTLGLKLKAGNGESTYWVEYRTKDGANTDGVQINITEYVPDYDSRKYYYDTSYLLDMTPNSILQWEGDDWTGYDLKDAELVVGKSYTDKWGAFTITTKRVGGELGTADAWIELEVEMH